jgi:hypothetical protein
MIQIIFIQEPFLKIEKQMEKSDIIKILESNNPKVDYWNYVVFHSLYDKIAGEILKLENTSKYTVT